MSGKASIWKYLLSGIGKGCLGGFEVDEQGRLIEEYAEDDEDWPEEIYSGDESQDGEDLGWTDCVWNYSECSPS